MSPDQDVSNLTSTMKTLVVLFLVVACCNAALDQFFLVRNSVIPDSNNLGRNAEITPEECAVKCLDTEGCKSFQYKAEHKKCDLSTEEVKGSELVRSVHGWEVYSLFPNRARVAELKASLDSHTQEMNDLQESMASVETNMKRTELALQNATAQIERMTSSQDELAGETDTLVALLQSSNDTLAEVVASYEELMETKGQLSQTLSEQESQLSELKSSSDSLSETAGEKDKTLRDIYSEKASIEGQLAEMNGAVHILQTHVTSLSKQVKQLQSQLDAADEPEVYVARDCYELYDKHGVRDDGVYNIYPFGYNGKSVKAYCYMGDGGGWTVIQQRDTSKGCSLSFHKTWAEYKTGFGTPGDEYWLGNDAISALSTKRQELKVYTKNSAGQYRYSHYRDFRMGSQSQKYSLRSIAYRTGNAGDMLSNLKNSPFSTHDKENNNAKCSGATNGGYWFTTSRYCARKSWWSCSRYAYSCSGSNMNARTPIWNSITNWSVMRIRTQ